MAEMTEARGQGCDRSLAKVKSFKVATGSFLCRDKAILCRDIVSLAERIFYRDRGFLGRDRVGKARSSLSRHIILMSQ